MPTYHLHIEGQVQGVGFRPYVYRQATRRNIVGWVSNEMDGVHVEFNTDAAGAAEFCAALVGERPAAARIVRHRLREITSKTFSSFCIRESNAGGRPNLLLTPDLGMCDRCRAELHDPANRRYRYPFITCTDCGPRYSIITGLPYDRPRTAMQPFSMCPDCLSEYHDPENRRYFSQTNSCPNCAIELWLSAPSGKRLETNPGNVVQQVVSSLQAGKILAVKGIGGFLLLTDATNAAAVAELRRRKHRPSKPFALLYPGLDALRADAWVTEAEARAFTSIESPIVLVKPRPYPASGICLDEVAPGLRRIGAMQPYAPLLELILTAWGKPVVATSGNRSGSAIVYQNDTALRELGDIADLFVLHNRDIIVPQDDSVVQFAPHSQQRIVLRRARGYAPTHVQHALSEWPETVLAAGADLKGAFALQHAGNTYVGPYLGDLEKFDALAGYQTRLDHLCGLLDARPARVLADRHDGYQSTIAAGARAVEWQAPLEQIHHHEAHLMAVLAENDLLASDEPVLGFVADGTGLGNDGQVWGGEIFLFDRENGIRHAAQIEPFPVLLGDKMAREPRLSALSLFRNLPDADPFLRPLFTEQEWSFYQKLRSHPPALYTSSVGRLFDGVAALLGLQAVQTYEGEAALRLEQAAWDWLESQPAAVPTGGPATELRSEFRIPYSALRTPHSFAPTVEMILRDRQNGEPVGAIAYRFHRALVEWCGAAATAHGVKKIAFSGGVFQNALLVDLCFEILHPDFDLYFHQQLSPNDENIAFGQLTHHYYHVSRNSRQNHRHQPTTRRNISLRESVL